MANIPSPFIAKVPTLAEIEAESAASSLRCLLQIYRKTSRTLAGLEKAVPESSLHLSWKEKVEKARVDYLETAQKMGISEADAWTALAEGPP